MDGNARQLALDPKARVEERADELLGGLIAELAAELGTERVGCLAVQGDPWPERMTALAWPAPPPPAPPPAPRRRRPRPSRTLPHTRYPLTSSVIGVTARARGFEGLVDQGIDAPYRMKRPLPDGRTHLVLDGVGLLRKLAPLIPPPRFHLLRFHGVFASNSKLRSLVVPKPPACAVEQSSPAEKPQTRPAPSPCRLDWAAALRRVYGIDVLQCAPCGGRLVVLAFIEKLTAVRAILDQLGLPSTPLPLGKARGPPQAAWDF